MNLDGVGYWQKFLSGRPSDGDIQHDIGLLDYLQSLDEDERMRLGWTRQALAPGAVLFEEGAPADQLFVVASGDLALSVGGTEIAQFGPGDVIGETSVFHSDETRMGRVTARESAELFVLSRYRLVEMRDDNPEFYTRLLQEALQDIVARIERTDAQLGAPTPDAAAGDTARAEEIVHDTPPEGSIRALSALPGMNWINAQTVSEVRDAGVSRFVPAGEALFLAGDWGESMFVVVDGALELMFGAEVGATFESGSLLGAGHFVKAEPRTCTAVARKDSWVLELGPAAHDLAQTPRMVLLESVLSSLRMQLEAANVIAARVKAAHGPGENMVGLMAAAARLEGWRAGDPLNEMSDRRIIAPPAVAPVDDGFAQSCEMIRTAIIGKDIAIDTPFGERRVVYADYTASGRSLSFIEDYMRERVMPLYANTHTESSASGLQTTRLREEARAAIAKSVHATEADEVIFVGSGATGAINRLVDLMGLRLGPGQTREMRPEAERPVVFIGPYEHHSNILPWRHSAADVVEIPVNDTGELDLAALQAELEAHADRPLKIGSFSAASNVTGLATHVDEVAKILHDHGAWSFWDYAAAGPYVPIDMNPATPGTQKDAIFISPHKFVGGPGTPGLLILKKELVTSAVPTQPGGGTVDFVTASDAIYSASILHREESGTPAILESIRCGLAFKLKDEVGPHRIHQMETRYVRAAIDSWTRNPKIRVLGPLDAERISIVSFLIRHGRGFLHYNFVVALLNDLFGLQSRGGCSCAGPYGARLMGLNEEAGTAYTNLVQEGLMCYKPGWTRVNFNYFISEEEFRYIVEAVQLVALYGYALLPEYELDPATGIWSHRGGQPHEPASLAEIDFSGGTVRWPESRMKPGAEVLRDQLEAGRRILEAATHAVPEDRAVPDQDAEHRRWRWFPLPEEQGAWLRHVNGAAEAPVQEPDLLALDR